MRPLLQAIKEQRLYLDGGMGSMLQAAGLPEGMLPDVWGMESPAAVQAVHRAYLEAGSRLITTNTFGTCALKLAPYGVTPSCAPMGTWTLRTRWPCLPRPSGPP